MTSGWGKDWGRMSGGWKDEVGVLRSGREGLVVGRGKGLGICKGWRKSSLEAFGGLESRKWELNGMWIGYLKKKSGIYKDHSEVSKSIFYFYFFVN